MKVGIVGAGLVGSTAAYALIMKGVGREIVLVDRDVARAHAEADDLTHAVPFSHPLRVSAGGYDALAGASVVVVAAGVSQQPGESRMELLGRNRAVFSQVIPSILENSPGAVLVIATNPVDVMTHVADHIAREHGALPGSVFGTGTTLDTARFRTLLAGLTGVDSQHVHSYVLGEHGDTEVLAWSSAMVAGLPLVSLCADRDIVFGEAERIVIDDAVRRAAVRIIESKGATYYGVGSAIARIVDTVLSDRRSVLTVCAPATEILSIPDVTISLPRLVGGAGILDTFDPLIDGPEAAALFRSAQTVRAGIDEAFA